MRKKQGNDPISDPISDQEMAFARLVLSGTVTDRQAAEAAGLNPNTAAHTKAKPRVQAYLLECRAVMKEALAQQETEALRRKTASREQVLARLWEIANLNPETTRNSASAQIKALSLIVAIEGLIPDRRAPSTEKKTAFPPVTTDFYRSEWFLEKQKQDAKPQPDPDLLQQSKPVPAPPRAPSHPGSTQSPDTDPVQLFNNPTASSAATTRWVPDAFESEATAENQSPSKRTIFPFVWGR